MSSYHSVFVDLQAKFPDIKIQENVPLAPYTTLRIGGPADILAQPSSTQQLVKLLEHVSKSQIPLQILGGGSNVLISDYGLRGLVIRNLISSITIDPNISPGSANFQTTSTHRTENEPDQYLDFTKLDYDESHLPTQLVTLTAGTPLPLAINRLLAAGLTGLQWFAYIPGTIGGAVFQNIHGGKYHLSDYLVAVKTFDLDTGKTSTIAKSDSDWSYETSPFKSQPNLIILEATLRLFRGDTKLASNVAQAWITQKQKVQPMTSAGCVFANPPLNICQKLWGEQKSTGWIIDHQLGLKGHQIGGAQISLQHSNFIVNTGTATAADYHSLIKLVQDQVQQKFGFTLTPEITLLGQFD